MKYYVSLSHEVFGKQTITVNGDGLTPEQAEEIAIRAVCAVPAGVPPFIKPEDYKVLSITEEP